ncbi:hypothetical protein DFR79_101206 [Halanaerobium saccharolyticum]|uniref:Uncharacterized protein n=1 Tax=Halanaerobium saccharolyticum TaxID=43595 RepID=A0A4R6M3H3_9FIRM|nr:hypothetical protein [Halanaerobium saccharolyticum]TDO95205.1 hypothetical protein DFR79_101206 [Halanaerobium saccharolyticum]
MDQELLDGIRQIVREEISGVKDDVSSLKADISELKSDVAEIERLLGKNNHLLRVLRIETDTNEIKMSIIDGKIDNLIDNLEKQTKLKDALRDHHHQIVIETGEPVFND